MLIDKFANLDDNKFVNVIRDHVIEEGRFFRPFFCLAFMTRNYLLFLLWFIRKFRGYLHLVKMNFSAKISQYSLACIRIWPIRRA